MPKPPSTPERSGRRPGGHFPTRWFLAIVAGLAACAYTGELDEVPEEVRGVWVTDEPRYADRAFQLDADMVIFDTGESLAVHPLQAIDTTRSAEGTLLELRYRSEGLLYAFDLFYRTDTETTIRFKNQPEITWRRTDRPLY